MVLPMVGVLEQIIADKRARVQAARDLISLKEIRRRAVDNPSTRDFFAAVTRPQGQLRVIAEVKRASPSAGVIRADFDPQAIASAYHVNGAAAISCLTDEKYFHGSLDHITRIRQSVPLPVLCKDFIIDPSQVYQTRAAGADAVLLIAECLPTDSLLLELMHQSEELGMTTLLEVHTEQNLRRVRPHLTHPRPPRILLGINNRDLTTMTTDLSHTLGLLQFVDNVDIVVSESGIKTADDVTRLRRAGVHRILVGEHLMRQEDIGAALRRLVQAPT